MKKPTIIIVDDNQTFRQSLILLITVENFARVIGKASNGIEFIELLANKNPDLVLMDIDMPEMNGIEATKKALEILPGLKIIVFSMYGNEEYYSRMIELGVKGYLLKSCRINEFERAIQLVMNGGNYFFTDIEKDIRNKKLKKTDIILSDDSDLTVTEKKLIQNIYSKSLKN